MRNTFQDLKEECSNNYDYTCGDTRLPNNNISTVELPNDSWSQDKCMVEFRHNLTFASFVKGKVDPLKLDGNLVDLCYCCSWEDLNPHNKVKGHRATCDTCMETKQLVKVSSKKSDGNRAADTLVKRIGRKEPK